MIAQLERLSVSIALTSDIWNAHLKQDYLCVMGHYLDSDWMIQKRIPGFRPVDFQHTVQNIYYIIFEVLNDFRLTGRIISLTLDNASSNMASINLLLANNVPQARGSSLPLTVCMSHYKLL